MDLLERQPLLGQLDLLVDAAGAGRGGVVFIGGDAGVGKSSVVRHLIHTRAGDARVWVGACDPLATPRPFGPLCDLAGDLDAELAALLSSQAARSLILSRLMHCLGGAALPDLLVIEDAHWADEATLDVLRFLGRRVGGMPVLVVVTYRDVQMVDRHPLRVVLGDLATTVGVHRVVVSPLSAEAVAVLCRAAGRDPGQLHASTGGNPFYVTECLAGEPGEVPETVVDAVLARTARLSESARTAIETVSVAGPATTGVLAVLPGVTASELYVGAAAGLLVDVPLRPRFRHELARLAVLAAVRAARRVAIHAAVLAALRRVNTQDLTLLVHHAEGAGDGAAVREYGPRVAAQAARAGAHREAAAHYERVLRYSADQPAATRAVLLEQLAEQRYLGGRPEQALADLQAAAVVWTGLGDALRRGDALQRVARLQQMTGRAGQADMSAAEAIRLLEGLRPGPELARAYNNAAWLNLVNSRLGQASELGGRAAALATRVRDEQTAAHARITVGAAGLQSYHDAAHQQLMSAWEQARLHGWQEHAARAIWNVAIISVWQRRSDQAKHALDAGAAYCYEHGLESWGTLLHAARARWLLDRGRWDEAVAEATAVLELVEPVALARVLALTVTGRVAARRGQAKAADLLAQAVNLSADQSEMQPFAPIQPALAEQAWLAGDPTAAVAAVRANWAAVQARGDPWELGESCYWLWRSGTDPDPGDAALAHPYAVLLAGDTAAAAIAWDELDCPYEQAEALAMSEQQAAVRAAVDIFDKLRAAPAAANARRHLRALGATHVARGPLPTTRRNPIGLTPREAQVLELAGHGLSNPQIANRLFLSVKTIEHHISAALRKTGATDRAAAAELARDAEMGVATAQDEGMPPIPPTRWPA